MSRLDHPTNGADRWTSERRNRIKLDGAIRRIECPFCGALVGEDCRSKAWYAGDFHQARRMAARS